MKHFAVLLHLSLILSACARQESPIDVNRDDGATNGIVGGVEVRAGSREIYSTVGLYDQKEKFLCTATLIGENLILTAGHCISDDPKQMVVVFKERFADAKDEDKRSVTAAIRHESYDPKRGTNIGDVAVARFESRNGLPSGYGPARLLPDFSLLKRDAEIVAVGYGLNRSWIFKSGSGVLRTTELKVKDPGFSETEIMVDQSLKKGVCSGDSGGPGYFAVGDQLYLWGVVSRGDSLPIPLTPDCFLFSVYTRVDVYAEWIAQASQALLAR